MDTKEAMKVVAEQVIVKGDERIEEALQTVEKALGLKPVISHGAGQPFHYVEEVDRSIEGEALLNYYLDDSNWLPADSCGIQHFKESAYNINSHELGDIDHYCDYDTELAELLANDPRIKNFCQTRANPELVNEVWTFIVGELAYQIDVWPYSDVTPYQIRRWEMWNGC